MKLNLLPPHVSKGSQVRNGIILGIIMVGASLFLMMFMISSSQKDLQDAREAADALKPQAQAAVDIASQAETILSKAGGVILNTSLAKAMDSHNSVYPAFYDDTIKYIPSFYRITALSASPIDKDRCVVRMTGVIHTFQQYADLMLGLLRIPGAQTVSRSGYQLEETTVPNLTAEDQVGVPVKTGEPRMPSNLRDRLDVMIAQAHEEGYNSAGNFGTDLTPPIVRGAMPHWSVVTVAVVVPHNLQCPDPAATLAGAKAVAGPPQPRVVAETSVVGAAKPGTTTTTTTNVTVTSKPAGKPGAPAKTPAAKPGTPGKLGSTPTAPPGGNAPAGPGKSPANAKPGAAVGTKPGAAVPPAKPAATAKPGAAVGTKPGAAVPAAKTPTAAAKKPAVPPAQPAGGAR
jgi:hypothetical protein